MLEEIRTLQRNGQLDLAAARCHELIAAEPGNAGAYRLASLISHEQGNLAQALEYARAAHTAEPDHAGHLAYLGGLEFGVEEIEPARVHLSAALRLDPNIASAHLFLGYIALGQRDTDAAQTHFKSAERIDPNDARTLASLGNLALQRSDADLAARYYTRAVELAPNDASMHVGLARAFRARGAYAFAEQAFENALRLKPQMHGARYWLSQLHMDNEHAELALPGFTQLLEVEEFKTLALVGLGDVARAQGSLADALPHYRAALAREPRQPLTAMVLARSLFDLGDVDGALATYAELLAQMPDEPNVSVAQAELLSIAGRHTEALAAWQAWHGRFPQDPRSLARLPLLLEAHGHAAPAVDLANAALAANAADVDARFVLARAALNAQDGAAAMHQLQAIDTRALPEFGKRQWNQHYGFALDLQALLADAAACWALAQHGLPADGTPWLAPVPAGLAAQLAAGAVEPDRNVSGPVFLLGAPGSGIDQLVQLLAGPLQQYVLGDRYTSATRLDLFTQGDFDSYAALDATQAAALGAQYHAALTASAPGVAPVLDWLPRWDARFLPAVQQALPGARFIVLDRDPRATLLNWLACGAMPGFALPDLDAATEWLVLARQHQAAIDNVPGIHVLHVDADRLQADPESLYPDLLQFLQQPMRQVLAAAPANAGGNLPGALPVGHWQAYRAALAAQFSRIESSIEAAHATDQH